MTTHLTVYLATDHAGFKHKEFLKNYLTQAAPYANKITIEDMGCTSAESCDYPDFIIPAAQKVAEQPEASRAIIFGGSGQGEAMAANRIKGVRATTYYHHNLDILELSRTHNQANVLSIGARFILLEEMIQAVDIWLPLPGADAERHLRRINKIDELS